MRKAELSRTMECACLQFPYSEQAIRAAGRMGPTGKALLYLSSTLVLYP